MRVSSGRDDFTGQLALELHRELRGAWPLQVVDVAVVLTEDEAVRRAKLIQLWNEIAVQVAGRRLPSGARRPDARVAGCTERIEPQDVLQRDRLVVAAAREFDRRAAVAEDVVDG